MGEGIILRHTKHHIGGSRVCFGGTVIYFLKVVYAVSSLKQVYKSNLLF